MPSCYASFDLLATMVVVTQVNGDITHVNSAFEDAYGLSARVLPQLNIFDLLSNASLKNILGAVSENGISAGQFEDMLKRPLGQSELPVQVIVVRSDIEGQLIIEMLPIEQQVRMEREARQLEQTQVNKGLIRNLAHEIKNPLGGIRGAAQLLQMEVVSSELIEYTQVIIHEADRLQALVDRLLEPHRKAQVLESVNIHEVCERVCALILAQFPQGLEIVRDYDTSIPELQADKSQIIQTVLNVAQNAAQALEHRIAQGDAVMELRTRVSRQVVYGKKRHKLALELHIIDNGPGVSQKIRERIFYPLVSGREGGSGLGLTLVQTFVQQHQGFIECSSRPGHTDFTIYIPL